MGLGNIRAWAVVAVALLAAGCGSTAPGPVTAASRTRAAGTGRWTPVPASPLGARYGADGLWVGDRFVVLGGWSSPMCPAAASCVAPVEPARHDGAGFDPQTGRWTRITDAPAPLSGLNTVVAGGLIYTLTGDQGRADSPTMFLCYDPGRDAWTTHPLPPAAGYLVAAGDTVLVVPGSDETIATDAAFDPKTNIWKELPDDPLGPSFDREAVWVDGGLLLAAKDLVPNPGSDGPALVRLARLDAALSTWSMLPDSELIGWGPVAVGHRAVWPATGSADGGEVNGWGRSHPEGGILDLPAGTWHRLPRAPGAPGLAGWEATVGDRLLVGGHLLDPATRGWTRVPPLPGTDRSAPTVVGSPDSLLVWGGSTPDTRPSNLSSGYLLRPG